MPEDLPKGQAAFLMWSKGMPTAELIFCSAFCRVLPHRMEDEVAASVPDFPNRLDMP